MYFSKLRVNGSRPSTIKLFKSDENAHACMAASTPGSGRTLWRLDTTSTGKVFYVLSEDEPDFTGFKENYGYPTLDDSKTFSTVDYDELLNRLDSGQEWYFETVVNPTIKRNGKVVPLKVHGRPDDDMMLASDWIQRKFDDAASILDLRTMDDYTSVFFKKGTRVKLHKVRFNGVLSVKNVDAFKEILTDGIGRGKAYGCGLVTLAEA